MVMFVFVHAGFAPNSDSSFQLGFVITLMYKHSNAKIVHYCSWKSKHMTRSVLACALFTIVYSFGILSMIRLTLKTMVGCVISLHVYTDSRSVYYVLTLINQTTVKRLLMDVPMLRESNKRRDITEVVWILTEQNHADAFTKGTPSPPFQQHMPENRAVLTTNAWREGSFPTLSKAPQQPVASFCATF